MISVILLIGFIRTVLILLIIFYAIRLITRFILPFFLQKTIRDMQSRMNDKIKEQQRQGKREGEVTIERNTNQKGRSSQGGEYIDFEEVE
jgi:uncharacterized membrane protein required for colicin V production